MQTRCEAKAIIEQICRMVQRNPNKWVTDRNIVMRPQTKANLFQETNPVIGNNHIGILEPSTFIMQNNNSKKRKKHHSYSKMQHRHGKKSEHMQTKTDWCDGGSSLMGSNNSDHHAHQVTPQQRLGQLAADNQPKSFNIKSSYKTSNIIFQNTEQLVSRLGQQLTAAYASSTKKSIQQQQQMVYDLDSGKEFKVPSLKSKDQHVVENPLDVILKEHVTKESMPAGERTSIEKEIEKNAKEANEYYEKLKGSSDSNSPSKKGSKKIGTEEVKDSKLVFQTAIRKLEKKYGRENMVFPKEVYFLLGAPGAGKGTMTETIMEDRGLTSPSIEVSSLLNTPEMKELKNQGFLISDRLVTELVLEKLLTGEYKCGVIVDGFPRTTIQAELCGHLHDYMLDLRKEYMESQHINDDIMADISENEPSMAAFAKDATDDDALFTASQEDNIRAMLKPRYPNATNKFRRPYFRIVVLYVDEEVSVCRQLERGDRVLENNQRFLETGHGEYMTPRETDTNQDAAQRRYKFFCRDVHESLKTLKAKFSYNFIDASGSIDEVKDKMRSELKYQSSLELGPETFNSISGINDASQLIVNARQNLIQRLDNYQLNHPDLFHEIINIIQSQFMHILRRQALTGVAIIRSENPLFSHPEALNILLDILTERGYTVILDYERRMIPHRINPDTHRIEFEIRRIYHFKIHFPKPKIR